MYTHTHTIHHLIGELHEVGVLFAGSKISTKQRIGDYISLHEAQLDFRANTATESAAGACVAQLQTASFIKQLYFFSM